MKPSETGEARIRGYLFVLSRSLRSFLPATLAEDALREVESHVRERLEQEPDGDERAIIERVLAHLGTPQRVAQAYSTEMVLEEAVTTGRFVPTLRAVWHLATTSLIGFLWGLVVVIGWSLGVGIILVAPLKILFPNNVGVFYLNGHFEAAGAVFGLPPGTEAHPFGYWVVPVAALLGVAALVVTQRASRAVLAWLRSRRSSARFRVHVDVVDR